MKSIQLIDLERAHACSDQCALFAATFGSEVTINPTNLAKGRAAGLYAAWCAHLLSPSRWRHYRSCVDMAWAKRLKAVRPTLQAYLRDFSATSAAAYMDAAAAAWAEYDSATGEALLSALLEQPEPAFWRSP